MPRRTKAPRKLYTPDESVHKSPAKRRPKSKLPNTGLINPKKRTPKGGQRATGGKKQLPVQRRGKRAAIRRKPKRVL